MVFGITRRRRDLLRAKPVPHAWRAVLQRNLSIFRRLSPEDRAELLGHVHVFLAEKHFEGCGGLELTEEIRVTIAAQACLLILNRRSFYYPELRQILVYPNSFVVKREHTDGAGIKHSGRQVLAGESWSNGQVVLSWHDTLQGAAVPDDGNNVVIHEFAHQLDQEKGAANGAPTLAQRAHYRGWSKVLNDEYRALQARRTFRGERIVIPHVDEPATAAQDAQEPLFSDYGATDPAEFFAVISEVFFERPSRMAREHSALYQELARFYRVDPLTWR